MFTGLIEEMGTVLEVCTREGSTDFVIGCTKIPEDLRIGDSVAVNGVCLTATEFTNRRFAATATQETLNRTNLATLVKGFKVNLERSLTLQSRMGGHMVQGHVDGTGKTRSITREGDSQRWEFTVPTDISRQLIFKGSVAINGVSLTIASINENVFTVALIPKTIELTTFQFHSVGDIVNVEVDMIGKYVFRFLEQATVNTQ